MASLIDVQLEEIERGMMLALRANLPTALDQVAMEMTLKDAEYYAAIGVSPVPNTPIPMPAVFISGHDPLVLERPLEDFPNLAVVCYVHPLSGFGQTEVEVDQGEFVLSTVYSEIFANSDDSQQLNRMSKRYAKGMHRAIQMDLTMGGSVFKDQVSPEVDISNVVVTPKTDLDDEWTYFQGCRLQYTFKTIQSPYW